MSGAASDAPMELLYRREYSGLVRLAFSLTSSSSVAEEVAQEAFVSLHRSQRPVRNPPAFLRTCVVNACRSHHRHRLVVERSPSPRPDVHHDHYDELYDAVSSLPWRQQAALAMRFQLDLPDHEIAASLGCRPTTVRSLIFRGLAVLRKDLYR